MADLQRLDEAARDVRALNPHWRKGQAYFNMLARLAPTLAEQIRSTALDPFYCDERLPAFRAFIETAPEASDD